MIYILMDTYKLEDLTYNHLQVLQAAHTLRTYDLMILSFVCCLQVSLVRCCSHLSLITHFELFYEGFKIGLYEVLLGECSCQSSLGRR